MRYARIDNGDRRFNVEEFLTAQQIQSYFPRAAAKLKHAVTAQSGHDSIDDNDSQAAQEQEAYSSARLAVLHQCELLHPIVYDTLNICSLNCTQQQADLSLVLICRRPTWDIAAGTAWDICEHLSPTHNLSQAFTTDLPGKLS